MFGIKASKWAAFVLAFAFVLNMAAEFVVVSPMLFWHEAIQWGNGQELARFAVDAIMTTALSCYVVACQAIENAVNR